MTKRVDFLRLTNEVSLHQRPERAHAGRNSLCTVGFRFSDNSNGSIPQGGVGDSRSGNSSDSAVRKQLS